MAQGNQDKSEAPSGKRLEDARSKGQIPKSRDLTSTSVLVTGGVAIYLSRNHILSCFQQLVEYLWSKESFTHPGVFAPGFFLTIMLSLLSMMAPVVLAIVLTAVILNLGQTKGLIVSFEALHVSFNNINPLSGLKKMFSLRSLTEFAKAILKMVIVSYVAYSLLWPERGAMADLAWQSAPDFLSFTGTLALKLLFRVAGFMLIVSILDFCYQKWQTKKDLRMTKQEVKEEAKQNEGNPQMKAKIRSLQRAMARKRMLGKVPKASVIVTNPTHFAVALLYEPGMQAPVVLAKGIDFLALKIIAEGRKHGVSIVRNPPLARALYKQVKLDEIIPAELYRAVAKILAYIYQQKQRK
ncbi:MAG: flagellar biosynthesis protein FlhB [Syntrophobacteraceae bacterium]|nr:flagellar biosynthesis protein FlhB [Syntrophobacteraceae bacterium]